MKNLIITITMILSFSVCAQNEFLNTNVFVRVYGLQGKKIGKGKIHSISETSLKLNRNGELLEIPVSKIGSIKTKHSRESNLLIGASIGATITALTFAAISPPPGTYGPMPSNKGIAAALGAGIGAILGTLVGVLTIFNKLPEFYSIGGDMAELKAFKEVIINK